MDAAPGPNPTSTSSPTTAADASSPWSTRASGVASTSCELVFDERGLIAGRIGDTGVGVDVGDRVGLVGDGETVAGVVTGGWVVGLAPVELPVCWWGN